MTFTAGIQPQGFETTLYCRIHEVISEHVHEGEQLGSTGDNQSDDEEIFAQQWDRLASTVRKNDGKERQEHAVSSLTGSTNQKLPRLSAKGPLRFPSSATIKPLTDDVQGTRSEQKKKNKGILYLTVSGSICAAENWQREPEMFSGSHTVTDDNDAKSLEEQLLVEMLGEAMQEMVDAQVVESRLQNTKAAFFEQYGITSSPGQDLLNTIDGSKSIGTNDVCTSSCEVAAMREEVPAFEESVDAFDLAKVMLEFMLFDIIKEFHDSSKDLSSLGP